MHERLFQWRRVGALLCVGALAIGAALAAPPQPGSLPDAPSTLSPGDDQDRSAPALDRARFERSVAWWPFTKGPHYGSVDAEHRRADDVIHTMVGSYRIGAGLNMPAELLGDPGGPKDGRPGYFIVQSTPSGREQFEKALLSEGAEIVLHMPVNAVVARMDASTYGAVSALSAVQHIEPYHPGLKIDPIVGTTPRATKAQASSPNFDLTFRLFRDENPTAVAGALEGLGAQVISQSDDSIRARLHASRIVDAAKIPAIQSITDYRPDRPHSWGSLFLQSETVDRGDFPFWKVGLDGDGQVIHQTDSGLSADGGDMAHTASASGWDPGNDPAPGVGDPNRGACNVIDDHRKVICYRTSSNFGGNGDLQACDAVDSLQFTHGQVTAGVAVGNATRGQVPVPANGQPSPTDDPDSTYGGIDYGQGIFSDNNENGRFDEPVPGVTADPDYAFDGIAKGARIIMNDAQADCPEGGPFAGGFFPGDESENITEPWDEFGVYLHSFSWGSGGAPPTYTVVGNDIDQAIIDNPINLAVWSAGNPGSKENTASSATSGNVGDQCTAKNILCIGASSENNGSVAAYSAEGPPSGAVDGPDLRVAPHLVAEGGDGLLQEYGCRSDDDDQEPPVSCTFMGTQGTSFSAPNVIGAAAIVGEYLAEGFYPDGTDNNSNNEQQKVDTVSSALTKAILIAGAAPMGIARDSSQARFNNVYGYGRVQLDNTLPLSDFPTSTPSGMILHDLPGDIDEDGDNDGVSNLDLSASLAPGNSTTAEFDVVDDREDLKIALVWHDPATSDGSLARDLDLTVRYCGADQDCSTAGDNVVWYGNAFSEDHNRDEDAFFDLNDNGVLSSYNYSMSEGYVEGSPIPQDYETWRDTDNNNEAVYIPWSANQPTNEDRFDIVQTGVYEVEVSYDSSGTGDSFFSLAIIGPVAAGSSVRFDRNPAACNGLQNVSVTEVENPDDPGCTDPDNCPPSVIDDRTTINVYDGDPDNGGTLVDSETNLTFEQIGAASGNPELRFRLAEDIGLTDIASFEQNDGFLSVDDGYVLEVIYEDQTASEVNQQISQASVDCQPAISVNQIQQLGPDSNFVLIGGCDDDNYLDKEETFEFQVSFANTDPVDLIDATLELKVCQHRDNPTPENCTPAVNADGQQIIQVYEASRALGLLPSGSNQSSAFTFEVIERPFTVDDGNELPQMIDFDVCLSGSKTGQPVAACETFTLLGQADDEEHYYITDCPDGCTDVWFDRNGDEVYEERISRNPFDVLDIVRRGLRERNIDYESLRQAADEDGDGQEDCQQGANAGKGYECGNEDGFTGPWNFDEGIEGFRTGIFSQSEDSAEGIANFGEDSNWDGVADASLPNEVPSKIGNPNAIDYHWGVGGGCGWASNANDPNAPGGMFHTGQIGTWVPDHEVQTCNPDIFGNLDPEDICEPYDVYQGTSGEKFWAEFLRTPEIHPVHFGTDPRDGFDWRTQILDFSWALQADTRTGAIWSWEFDLDTTESSGVQLGDSAVGGLYGGNLGLLIGGNLPLTNGAHVFTPTNEDEGSSGYGDEKITTIGGNRGARRGCWFNDLGDLGAGTGLNSAADRPLNLPGPVDDECDNEFDLGPDGCPGDCGVDDDGNGQVDDPLEICPCKVCEAGPRAGEACSTDAPCNPDPTDNNHYDCAANTNSAGVPSGFGDDVCGGPADRGGSRPAADEGVFATFDLDQTRERVSRNGTPALGNGIGGTGIVTGQFRFNTLEDIFDPVGTSWQGEIGFIVSEPEGNPQQTSYGAGVDEVVVEWLESKPILQEQEDKCGVSGPAPDAFEGQCAQVSLAEESNTFAGDRRIEVSVFDPVPTGNETTCPSGVRGVEVTASSEAERLGETLCLEEAEPGANNFQGIVATTTRINKAGDGLVYTSYNNVDTPSITVQYIDKNDGVHPTNNGPDGQPGIAGFDDDGDGEVDEADELCPSQTQLAPGRTPHEPGQEARYSDDNCGCLENPLEAIALTQYDVADVIVEDVTFTTDDGDPYGDPGEVVTANVRFRNLADFPLEDLRFRATVEPGSFVECLSDDTIEVASLAARQPDCDSAPSLCPDRAEGTFKFVVNDDLTRDSLEQELRSAIGVTMNALAKASPTANNEGRQGVRDNQEIREFDVPISGFAVEQTFFIEHNLDITSEGSPTTYEESFESYTTDQDLFAAWAPKTQGETEEELDGSRCQYNDPFNPNGNNTGPQDFCEVGEGADNSINDWHLSGDGGCGSQGGPGFNCAVEPSPPFTGQNNRVKGRSGTQSLAFNWVRFDEVQGDNELTYHANRIQWIEQDESVPLRASGDASGNPPELEIWSQISLADTRAFGPGVMPQGVDAGVVSLCVDRNKNDVCDTVLEGGGEERWEVIQPVINPYSGFRGQTFVNCSYDPTDDGSDEDDFFPGSNRIGPSSTCYPQPIETCLGRTSAPLDFFGVGTNPTIGHPTCFPEAGEYDVVIPGLYEEGNRGTGVWAKQVFDLAPYAGQNVMIRFLVTGLGFSGVDLWGVAFDGFFNRDDGWFVDDITMTGVSTNDVSLAIDNVGSGPNQTCENLDTCSGPVSRAAVLPYPRNDREGRAKEALACNASDGQFGFCDFDNDDAVDTNSDSAAGRAPRQAFIIDAREGDTDTCFNGSLQYKFETLDGEILSDWSTRSDLLVDPTEDTTYRVGVRCSSDTTCNRTTTVTVDVPDYEPREFVCLASDLTFSDKTSFAWQEDANDACTVVFDLVRGDTFGASFFSGQVCLENDLAQTSYTDTTEPNAGTGLWYVVRHATDGTYSSGADSEEPGRDDNLTTCP